MPATRTQSSPWFSLNLAALSARSNSSAVPAPGRHIRPARTVACLRCATTKYARICSSDSAASIVLVMPERL